MLLVNADDWGRSVEETDAAHRCWKSGTVTQVSAMMFMADSERAAEIALGDEIPAGLHLNLTEPFSGHVGNTLEKHQGRVARFLKSSKLAQLVYNPLISESLNYTLQAQWEEFSRHYGRPPARIDGHLHMHLCANLLFSRAIPEQSAVRRNFSFGPGEKNLLNRTFRRISDRWLSQRYRLTDYFFALSQNLSMERLAKIVALSVDHEVELMTHPIMEEEFRFLMSDAFATLTKPVLAGASQIAA